MLAALAGLIAPGSLLAIFGKLVADALGSAIAQVWADYQRDKAQRDLGATRQQQQATLVAEAQEARARAAGDAAADGEDDPRDLLPERT